MTNREALRAKIAADVVYRRIRTDITESLLDYADFGALPGGFLTAVLCNDLRESVARADFENLAVLKEIVTFIYMELPASCWGSGEKVKDWALKFERETSR